MKDEIKKKIEEEALRRFPVNGIDYPKQLAQIQGYEKGYMDAMNEYHNTTCSCCHTKFNGQLFCIDCFEKGYSLAQQSVNIILLEALMEINKISIDEFDWYVGCPASKIHRITTKAILSASQQQEKEISAPAQIIQQVMKAVEKDVRIPNIVRKGLINVKQEKESDAVEFADWLIATRWVKVINGIGYYTSKELYELFIQSKTK